MASQVEDTGAQSLKAVTPSDTAYINNGLPVRGLWVGGAGNLAVQAEFDSAAVLLSGIAAGTLIPVRAVRVFSTNTTATLIVGLL